MRLPAAALLAATQLGAQQLAPYQYEGLRARHIGPVGFRVSAVAPGDPAVVWAARASDSDRVYALIETSDGVPMEGYETDTGELWRSDDGGRGWRLVNHSHNLATRQAYYTRCGVTAKRLASPDLTGSEEACG